MSNTLSVETTRGELLPILDLLAHGVARRTPAPLLTGVLVSPDGTVRTMDYETEIIGHLPGLVSSPESDLLVDFAALHAAVKVGGKIKASLLGRVTLTGTDNGGLSVATPHGTSTIRPIGVAADFPDPMAREGRGFAIDAAAFADAFLFASDAADKRDMFPVLTGLLLSSDGSGEMVVTACDHYRLHCALVPAEAPAGTSVIIPAAHCKLFSGLAKSGATATMYVESDAVTMRAGGITVTARTILGNYPKTENLVSAALQEATWAPVDLPALVAALKPYRSARDRKPIAEFAPSMTPAPVRIMVDGEKVAELAALLTGYPTDMDPVTLRTDFLAQTARIGSTDVDMGFSQPSKPVVLRAPGRVALVMPTRLP